MGVGKDQIGVIAQEIEPHAPYTLEKIPTKLNPEDEEDTDLWMYNDSALTYVLVNAVKDLNQKLADKTAETDQKIEKQDKEVQELKNRLDNLEKRLQISPVEK